VILFYQLTFYSPFNLYYLRLCRERNSEKQERNSENEEKPENRKKPRKQKIRKNKKEAPETLCCAGQI
jgi:hypothetical protein